MPKIKSKVIRVRNPLTHEWNDLPAIVSEESLEAAERAERAAEYNSHLPVVEAMEAAQAAEASARDAAHSLQVMENEFPEGIARATTDWLDDNVDPVGSAVAVDSSLLIEGAAADAKKTGDEIGDVRDEISGADGLMRLEKPLIVDSSGIWKVAGASHVSIPVKSGDVIKIKARDNIATTYSLLKKDNSVLNASVAFCTGYESRVTINAGVTTDDITAPVDCNFVCIAASNNAGAIQIPDSVWINGVDVAFNIRKRIQGIENKIVLEWKDFEKTLNGPNGLFDFNEPGIINSSGVWQYTQANAARHVCIPVAEGDTVRLVGNKTLAGIYAFLTDNFCVTGEEAHFCAEYESRITLNAGADTGNVSVPQDCKYLYLATVNNQHGIQMPAEVKINGVERTYGIRRKIDTIGKEITDFWKTLNGVNGLLDFNEPGIVNASGKWQYTTANAARHICIPVNGGDTVYMVANPSIAFSYAFLRGDSCVTGEDADFCEGYESRITLNAGASSGDIVLPYDCRYLYLATKNNQGAIQIPAVLTVNGVDRTYNIRKEIDSVSYANDPDSIKAAKLIKKAGLSFTPAKTVYASGSDDPENYNQFESGSVYSGIPYSATNWAGRDVLFDLSIESIFTSFRNPYSDLYKFDPFNDIPTTKSLANTAVWAGAVCATYVSWATNRPLRMVVDEIARVLQYKELDGPEVLEVGDVLVASGHVALITGFKIRDREIIAINTSEMTTPTFRSIWQTPEQFWKRIYRGGTKENPGENPYRIGRFADNYKIRTTPEVNLVDDVITNRGDNTYFQIGEDIWTYITDTTSSLTVIAPDGTSSTVDYTTLPQRSENETPVPVYNLKSVCNSVGLWKIKGAHGKIASKITVIDIDGTAVAETVSSGTTQTTTVTVTLPVNSGCTIAGYQVMTMSKNSGSFPVPAEAASRGFIYADGTTYWGSLHNVTTQSPITIDTTAKREKSFYVRVYLQTGCGFTFLDSNPIFGPDDTDDDIPDEEDPNNNPNPVSENQEPSAEYTD